jgi:enterochelin esterase-like enzyme
MNFTRGSTLPAADGQSFLMPSKVEFIRVSGSEMERAWNGSMKSPLRDFRIFSDSLNEDRTLTVYVPEDQAGPSTDLPVLLCADGQWVGYFARRIHEEIQAGRIAPIALVGVHTSEDTRNCDYVFGFHEARYEAHEHFVLHEVIPFLNETAHLKFSRAHCGIFGYSNGAVFSHSLAIRHPETFGVSIVFSATGNHVARSLYPPELTTAFYLSAGTQDRHCRKATSSIARDLRRQGIQYKFTEREARHDLSYWVQELPLAIDWAFARHK